jgi:hypothetical protein
MELFKNSKEGGYWDRNMLFCQAVERALPITEAYTCFILLSVTLSAGCRSVSIVNDALRADRMAKGDGGHQPFLRNGWFFDRNTIRVREDETLEDQSMVRYS